MGKGLENVTRKESEMEIEKFGVELTFTEDVLGATPKSKEVYAKYIKAKAPKGTGLDEVETVQEAEEGGWTGFHEDADGLFGFDYTIRGFLKEAATALKAQHAVKNCKSKIDRLVFVSPRRLRFTSKGAAIKEADGVLERPLRAMTMKGPRVTLARSDKLDATKGVNLKFTVSIVKNNEDVTKKWVAELFQYGELQGWGQFRNGSYGRFTTKIA